MSDSVNVCRSGVSVYTVSDWHSPEVSHGFEVLGIFSDRATAERYLAACVHYRLEFNTWAAKTGSTQFDSKFEVLEWTIDDPALMSVMTELGRDQRVAAGGG